MATAREQAKALRRSQLQVNGDIGESSAKSIVENENRRVLPPYLKIADDGAANTATAETPFAVVRRVSRVVAITIVGDAAIAADNTDYVTITVRKRTAADPATQVTLGTYDSRAANNGATVAWTKKEFTLTDANLALAVGDVLTVQIAKGGSGKVVTKGVIQVDAEDE